MNKDIPKLVFNKEDALKVLGVTPEGTEDDIKNAFKRLVRVFLGRYGENSLTSCNRLSNGIPIVTSQRGTKITPRSASLRCAL